LSNKERQELVDLLAANPTSGDKIAGTGGARKLRVKLAGRGKSGGARVITFYSGENIPVFLLDCFAKNVKITLSGAEKQALKSVLTEIVSSYEKRRGK
jgi:hypothetical protein